MGGGAHASHTEIGSSSSSSGGKAIRIAPTRSHHSVTELIMKPFIHILQYVTVVTVGPETRGTVGTSDGREEEKVMKNVRRRLNSIDRSSCWGHI